MPLTSDHPVTLDWRLLPRLLLGMWLGLGCVWALPTPPVEPASAPAAKPFHPRVLLVYPTSASAHSQAAKALQDSLTRSADGAVVEILDTAAYKAALAAGSLPVVQVELALGSQSCAEVGAAARKVLALCTLIPRASYAALLRSGQVKRTLSALYLDQPLRRQLGLIRLALPEVSRVGVLLGPESTGQAAELRAAARERGLVLQEARVAEAQSLYPTLRTLLEDSQVLLALADPLVYNSTNLQNILLTAWRARVPMVGFSPSYVRAGALLGIYTTPEQAGRQAAKLVLAALHGRGLPSTPQEPDDFEIEINAAVARTLNLSLDGARLHRALRAQENL
ncbi:MAG: hypothetical protein OHK0048_16330 [Rhodoferax sp.]